MKEAVLSLGSNMLNREENLKNAIRKSFPKQDIIINRNVASMEMLALSQNALKNINKNNDYVVLGYFSGSHTHKNDFNIIKDVILKLMDEHENVILKIVGVLDLDKSFEIYSERIIRINFVDWRKLPELISSVDINLMPLENNFFCTCKSENKWMEAALVKVPTVASFNDELARVIDNGTDGLLCATNEQWYKTLKSLIMNKYERERIGILARNKVMKKYLTLNSGKTVIDYLLNKENFSIKSEGED